MGIAGAERARRIGVRSPSNGRISPSPSAVSATSSKPRQKHKVTNWREYDAGLRQRGSLTVWFTDEAVQAWQAEPRTTRGGQPDYSTLAILTALTLRAVFRLALRQTEGLIPTRLVADSDVS